MLWFMPLQELCSWLTRDTHRLGCPILEGDHVGMGGVLVCEGPQLISCNRQTTRDEYNQSFYAADLKYPFGFLGRYLHENQALRIASKRSAFPISCGCRINLARQLRPICTCPTISKNVKSDYSYCSGSSETPDSHYHYDIRDACDVSRKASATASETVRAFSRVQRIHLRLGNVAL